MRLLARRFATWSLMWAVVQSTSVFHLTAQEPGPLDARWEVFVNSELDQYLRLMQLAGQSKWSPVEAVPTVVEGS